ncbi:hypothetical protein QUF74_04345 [Candidatus Halobeggiatoa sp. HSG11]|nr:hypothetical protein [Candidatus Halobeggiatoa sp. HSG11]
MVIRVILVLCLAGQAFAACEGPTLEDIQFTEKEYKMLKQVQEEEAILGNLGTLMSWSPLITLAGGSLTDTIISISTTDWDKLQNANKSLLKLRLRTAENVLLFIFQENPKNRQFWQALADYYQCVAS